MKDYIYRNDKGMEVKGTSEQPKDYPTLEDKGYKLQQVIDYEVTPEEKKAK